MNSPNCLRIPNKSPSKELEGYIPNRDDIVFIDSFLGLNYSTSIRSAFSERFRTLANFCQFVRVTFDRGDCTKGCRLFYELKSRALFFYNFVSELIKFDDPEKLLKKYLELRETVENVEQGHLEGVQKNGINIINLFLGDKATVETYLCVFKVILDGFQIHKHGSIELFMNCLLEICD